MVANNNINYYEILEIDINADDACIKSSYRRLARKYHPDVNPEKVAIEKFKKITEAYETLSDKTKRAQYDTINNFISINKSSIHAEAQRAYNEQKKVQSAPYRHTYKTPNEPKSGFSDIFSEILEGIKFTNKPHSKTPPINGKDIYTTVTISTSEAIEGTTRTLNILHLKPCANCKGRKFLNDSKCPICNGKGETSEQKRLNVKIPKFIQNGAKIRIANEGNQGQNGGTNGDIYLTVYIDKSSKFTYEGNNIFTELSISPFEAALGASIEIKSHKDELLTIKIPPCTSSGQKFRLANQGLSKNNTIGDLVVTVKIVMPKDLSSEEKLLYERLRLINKNNIREI